MVDSRLKISGFFISHKSVVEKIRWSTKLNDNNRNEITLLKFLDDRVWEICGSLIMKCGMESQCN